MSHRHLFAALFAIWGLVLAIEAFAQGAPTSAPGASSSLQDAVLLRSRTLFDYRVKSPQGEDLGNIEEVMIDMEMGRVAYAVLSFGGGAATGSEGPPPPDREREDPKSPQFRADHLVGPSQPPVGSGYPYVLRVSPLLGEAAMTWGGKYA
jgi:PRC-barrel domain